jgi:asparagine synthase (glutamine-hydrolysing)
VKRAIAEILDLVPAESQRLRGITTEAARALLLAEGAERQIGSLSGSYALVARAGERVALARSLDRPLRYFLAKVTAGPMLIVAERLDQIREALESRGLGGQFHPSYTRMVPAFHVTRIALVGCPDPNPRYLRAFDPPRGGLPPDLDRIGEAYVGALLAEARGWLAAQAAIEPIGVLFSGGIDSGAVLLALYRALLESGQSPARLKAFTLSVEGGGADAEQARDFLRQVELELLGETIEVEGGDLDPLAAVEVIEDYKPLDVECAAVTLALVRGIRTRYPDWRLLVDGDGGDENLKSYPIEENTELTIRSVVSNPLLYQQGWGVEAIKHSLTYSGGLSRGCVRGYAPLARHGFLGWSPFIAPAVIAVAEAIPFDRLTEGSLERLYALKGEVVARGVRQVLGMELPVYPKRRFQRGAMPEALFARAFTFGEPAYRAHLARHFGS